MSTNTEISIMSTTYFSENYIDNKLMVHYQIPYDGFVIIIDYNLELVWFAHSNTQGVQVPMEYM